MPVPCQKPSGLPRLAGSLGLSLVLPAALALSNLIRPELGLPNQSPAADCRQRPEEVCDEANLSQDSPDTPRSDLDSARIYLARRQYYWLVRCRRRSQALSSATHPATEIYLLQSEIAQGDENYWRLYHEVTLGGRRRAHLPNPAAVMPLTP